MARAAGAQIPVSGEFKMRKNMPYANHSGVLATAGGIVVTALVQSSTAAALIVALPATKIRRAHDPSGAETLRDI